MSDFGKGIMVILVILYIVSPVDFCPGPIDDLIVLLVGIAAQMHMANLSGRFCGRKWPRSGASGQVY